MRAQFERNFAERGEIGAAVAAYWRREKVVDLWGGHRTPEGDAPVARYWPEFAQNGKAAITVRQLLGHEAGLVEDRPRERRRYPVRARCLPCRLARAGPSRPNAQ